MRIGLMVPRHGPGGLWAAACDACTMLAAAEVNARGGVLDRPVELVLADSGTAAAEAAAAARDLVEVNAVDAVIGRHPSNVRSAIAAGIAGRVPYIYTSSYEGGEQNRNVLPIGGTDDELLGHAIPLLMERRRAERFFLFCNDYVWPRRAALSASRIVAAHGGRIVGASFVGFGDEDYSEAFARIARAAPDVVITLLLGEESVRFNRAFAAAGLSSRVLRLGLAVDETVLYGAGPHAHENLYVATTYVAAGVAAGRDGFTELYRESFGASVPPATVFGRSCYDAVHLLARIAHAGPRGRATTLLPRLAHLARRQTGGRTLPTALLASSGEVHLAEAHGLEFKVLASR